MKLFTRYLSFSVFAVLLAGKPAAGQQYKDTYGNIPKDYVAYDKYQKAYKYHFLEPLGFYGAGRE